MAERGADSSLCVLDGRAVEHAGSSTPAQLRKVADVRRALKARHVDAQRRRGPAQTSAPPSPAEGSDLAVPRFDVERTSELSVSSLSASLSRSATRSATRSALALDYGGSGTFESARVSAQCKIVVSPKRSAKKRSGRKSKSRTRLRNERRAGGDGGGDGGGDSMEREGYEGRGEYRRVASLGATSRSIDGELAAAGAPGPAPARALASASERIDTPTQTAALLGSEFVVERWDAAAEEWGESILEIKGDQLSELAFDGRACEPRSLRALVGLRQPSEAEKGEGESQLLLEWQRDELLVLYRLGDDADVRRLYELLKGWVGSGLAARRASALSPAAARAAVPAARGLARHAGAGRALGDVAEHPAALPAAPRTAALPPAPRAKAWSEIAPSELPLESVGAGKRRKWMGPLMHANLSIDDNLELYFRNYYAANSARRIRGLAGLVLVAKVAVVPVSFNGVPIPSHSLVEETGIVVVTGRSILVLRSAQRGASNGVFRDMPNFEVFSEYPVGCIARVAMGFSAQKLYVAFDAHGGAPSGASGGGTRGSAGLVVERVAASRWCFVTRSKEFSYALLHQLRAVAPSRFALANVDAVTLSAIQRNVFESSVEDPVLYVLLFARRTRRQEDKRAAGGGAAVRVPRTLVVTASRVYLCEENHSLAGRADPSAASEGMPMLRKEASAYIGDISVELERTTTHFALRCVGQRWALACELPSQRERIKSTVERLREDAPPPPRGERASRLTSAEARTLFS